MRIAVVALLIAMSLIGSAYAFADWAPDVQLIAKLENAIRIPNVYGRPPQLAEYARYYTGTVVKGRRAVKGVFLLRGAASAKPGIYIRSAKQMPLGINDGGCTEVQLLYDVTAAKVLTIQCNGLA